MTVVRRRRRRGRRAVANASDALRPIQRADIVSDQYYDWLARNAYLLQYGVWRVAPFLETFKEYPPSQRPASFSIDQMVEALMKSLEQKSK